MKRKRDRMLRSYSDIGKFAWSATPIPKCKVQNLPPGVRTCNSIYGICESGKEMGVDKVYIAHIRIEEGFYVVEPMEESETILQDVVND